MRAGKSFSAIVLSIVPRQTLVAVFVALLLLVVRIAAGANGATAVGSADHMKYLDNGHVRLGVDLGKGGAITYLAKSQGGLNIINDHDLGRQVQMSYYSGPVPFAPHGKPPAPAWAGLGWNPIQSGDYYGHPSRTVAYHNDGHEIYLRCIPMQWPLDNEPGECTFESWIRLDGDAIHVRNRLINHRSDTTQYPARGQELPAVYTNGPWYRLMTYTGDSPFTGDAVRQIPQRPLGSAYPWSPLRATENWAALVNDAGWGLGVWAPGVQSFSGGFFGQTGQGGPSDAPTGYIAPNYDEILDHDIQYDDQYVLIVGDLTEIRRYVYAHAAKPVPPDYRFAHDRQHWHYTNASDTGWPVAGELRVHLEQNDPQMIGPTGFWSAPAAPRLYVEAAFHTGGHSAQLFWTRRDAPEFSESKSLRFEVNPDGQYRTYAVDLASSPEYRDAITGLRLDPEDAGRPGDFVRVRSIGFRRPGR